MTQRMDPRKQFSKWLARFGSWIWAIYAYAVLALIAYRPEAAMACVWLTLIMTCNKALDTVSYTRNSTTEKIILGALERTTLELGLKGHSGQLLHQNLAVLVEGVYPVGAIAQEVDYLLQSLSGRAVGGHGERILQTERRADHI